MKNNGIAVIGLGFVGLPLSLSFSLNEKRVYGVDKNTELVKEINNGVTHHKEDYQDTNIQNILKESLKKGLYSAHSSVSELKGLVNAYIVTVGIPIKDGQPFYEHLRDACLNISKQLNKGDTVIIRSTVVPGMTRSFVKPLLESEGLMAGKDFHLAYASERIAEGRAFEEFKNMPLVIGGYDEESFESAKRVLSIVTKAEIHYGSSMEVVETSKVVENVQRDVNIAMVQEFANFARRIGIDTYELIRLANTHSRVNLLIPGAGVGGYCIPNAFHYLAAKSNELKFTEEMSVLSNARLRNDSIPSIVVSMVEESLNKVGKKLKGSTISVLGLAMKDYSNDDRLSPAIEVVTLLANKGACVKAYDPAVVTDYDFKVMRLDDCVSESDGVLMLTLQDGFKELDYNALTEKMNENPIFVDTKNIRSSTNLSNYKITSSL